MTRMLALFGLALLVIPGTAEAQAPAGAAEQVHVTLPGDGSGLVVQFAFVGADPGPADPPRVLWSDGGAQRSTAARLAGTVSPENVPDQPTTYVYAANLVAAPGTPISYRVGTPLRGDIGPFTVRVPPANGSLRFVAAGDIGYAGVSPDGSQIPGQASPPIGIRDLLLAQSPDLYVIPGDLSYANTRAGWDRFMRMYQPLQSRVPTMPAIGNHEWHDDAPQYGYSRFLEHYVLPGNEQDFAFQAGPVTFVVVNSDAICKGHAYRTAYGHKAEPCPYGEKDLERLQWLRDTLTAARADATNWTVVVLHHPAYSYGRHGSDIGQQILWAPLFEELGVDLVVAAHDHLYSRTYPVIREVPQATGTVYTRGLGPVYAVTGGGGRPLYALPDPTVEPRPAWHAVGESVYHILIVDATPQELDVRAVRLDGTELDAFQVRFAPLSSPNEPSPGAPSLPGIVALAAVLVLARSRRRPASR